MTHFALHYWMILRIYNVTIRQLWVLFYTTVRFYDSLSFYTTGWFYTSTMLLYANCQFCFTPLYVFTHPRFYDILRKHCKKYVVLTLTDIILFSDAFISKYLACMFGESLLWPTVFYKDSIVRELTENQRTFSSNHFSLF